MSLKKKVQDEVKLAMKSGNKSRLKVLRMVTAAIKQKEVDDRITINDSQTVAVINKMLKQRRDSIKQYQEANRNDLAQIEEAEIKELIDFMPTALTEEEITSLIDETIESIGAKSMADMGKVVGQIQPKVIGRADMAQISQIVKSKLAG